MKRFRTMLLPILACAALMASMQLGAMASSGATLPGWGTHADKNLKAGPLGINGEGSKGEVPIAISIPDAYVDAEIEKSKIVDGRMLDPSGPWVVEWYQETGRAGDSVDYRNMVLSGHIDYWGVGPSVFQSVATLTQGASISVTGEDGTVFTYAVDTIKQVDAEPSQEQLQDIAGKSKTPILTIITCGGEFDQVKGTYPERTIVRAKLVASQTPAQ
jgi:hypothetical protein